jgi:hypothetical protein
LVGKLDNPINQLLEDKFSNPKSWRSDRPLYDIPRDLGFSAITRKPDDRSRPGDVFTGNADDAPFLAVYGARVVEDDSPGQMVLQTSDLDQTVAIHQELAKGVLSGENVHTSQLMDPPYPTKIVGYVDPSFVAANNRKWLRAQKGEKGQKQERRWHWPVMATKKSPDGYGDYEVHDWSTNHTINSLLLPREAQNEVGEVAANALYVHTMSDGDKHQYEEFRQKSLHQGLNLTMRDLPFIDTKFDKSRHAKRQDGTFVDHVDGINVIESLTATKHYLPLLRYAMRGESGAAQVAALRVAVAHSEVMNDVINDRGLDLENEDEAKLALTDQQRKIIGAQLNEDREMAKLVKAVHGMQEVLMSAVEYNIWFAEGRWPTLEERDQKIDGFYTGLARVADKLAGRYTGPKEQDTIPDFEEVVPFWKREPGSTPVIPIDYSDPEPVSATASYRETTEDDSSRPLPQEETPLIWEGVSRRRQIARAAGAVVRRTGLRR